MRKVSFLVFGCLFAWSAFALGQANNCEQQCLLVNYWIANQSDADNGVCLYVDTQMCIYDYLYAKPNSGTNVTCVANKDGKTRPLYTSAKNKCTIGCTPTTLVPQVTPSMPTTTQTGMDIILRVCPTS
jgi:hypothetical protein